MTPDPPRACNNAGRVGPATILDRIERFGNKLPDPIIIFLWLILFLVTLSVIGSALGWRAINPISGEPVAVENLLSAHHVRAFLTEMPKTMMSFPPLGIVLLIMLGAGVAERVGLLSAAIRSVIKWAPVRLLTPAIVLIGLMAVPRQHQWHRFEVVN